MEPRTSTRERPSTTGLNERRTFLAGIKQYPRISGDVVAGLRFPVPADPVQHLFNFSGRLFSLGSTLRHSGAGKTISGQKKRFKRRRLLPDFRKGLQMADFVMRHLVLVPTHIRKKRRGPDVEQQREFAAEAFDNLCVVLIKKSVTGLAPDKKPHQHLVFGRPALEFSIGKRPSENFNAVPGRPDKTGTRRQLRDRSAFIAQIDDNHRFASDVFKFLP